MKQEQVEYSWERLPEYRSLQLFARSLGRVLASLPRSWRRRLERPMTRAATLVSMCIMMTNPDVPPGGEGLPLEDRARARELSLEGVDALREGLQLMREHGRGSQPDVLVAMDLLDRVEAGIRGRRLAA